jgi:lipopolysaccharide/colanic/teichoic acid biosynthesis glycosyltransferase
MPVVKANIDDNIALRNFIPKNHNSEQNSNKSPIYLSKTKRFSDVIVAATLIFITFPLMFIAAMLIKLDGGQVFFGHLRVGYQHRTFRCWKFRTMVVDADTVLADLLQNDPAAREAWNRDFKLPNDPRVTWIGRLMRVTSIDELPQLWNVLKGEMSLVGPRPVTPHELAMYDTNVADYLSCRPGITGLWQVSGRSDLSYDDRVNLDTHYVRSWTLLLDFKITLKTFGVVLGRKGAC